MLRTTPQAMPEAPAAMPVLSTTRTSSPSAARCHAVERPWTPAPMTRFATDRELRVSAISAAAPPSPRGRGACSPSPTRPRALDPRPELGLRELRVLLLEPDAVGVALLQVLDEHLARDLVLAARAGSGSRSSGTSSSSGRTRPACRPPEQVDVLEPVDVVARASPPTRSTSSTSDDVLLVGEALARRGPRRRWRRVLLGLALSARLAVSAASRRRRSGRPAARRSGSRGGARAAARSRCSARSSVTPGM